MKKIIVLIILLSGNLLANDISLPQTAPKVKRKVFFRERLANQRVFETQLCFFGSHLDNSYCVSRFSTHNLQGVLLGEEYKNSSYWANSPLRASQAFSSPKREYEKLDRIHAQDFEVGLD